MQTNIITNNKITTVRNAKTNKHKQTQQSLGGAVSQWEGGSISHRSVYISCHMYQGWAIYLRIISNTEVFLFASKGNEY